MKFAIYARRSEEKETGESIENQLRICKKYISLKFGDEVIIDEYFDDDFSGKNIKRPAFTKMMRLIKGGAYNYLVFWKLDRVSRNALEFLTLNNELQKNGVNLISVTEGFDPSTITGKLMMTILISVAEMERKNISLRVSTAMSENAKKGRWGGGVPPIGYKTNKVIENGIKLTYLTTDENIEIAKYIFENYKETNSFRSTSRNLKDKYNIYKSPVDVKRLLVNPIYVKSSERIKIYFEKQGFKVFGKMNGNGMISYGKIDYTSDDGIGKRRENENCIIAVSKHEGIISDIDFIKICEIVKKAKIGKPIASRYSFLTPFVYCSICGGRMRTKNNGSSNKYLYFVCTNKDTKKSNCLNKSIRIKKVEEDVLDELEYIYLHKEKFKAKTKTNSNSKIKYDKLIKQLDKNKKEIKILVRKSAENEDLKDEYLDGIRDIKLETKEIEISIEECKNQIIIESSMEQTKTDVIGALKNIKEAINNAKSIEQKSNIIKRAVERIHINSINKTIDIKLCQ